MKEKDTLKIAILVISGLIIVPLVWNAIVNLVVLVLSWISNFFAQRKFNKEMKKGVEDGSIVELNGEYFKVEVDTDEES